MFEWIQDINSWFSLFTLSILEIILGIDNMIFISLVISSLPLNQQNKARYLGLILAMIMRLTLLTSISWLMNLTNIIFSLYNYQASIKDLVLLLGSLFLMYKSTKEIYFIIKNKKEKYSNKKSSFFKIILQIILLDVVFSLDSVITAVGLSNQIFIMITAIIISVIFMSFTLSLLNKFIINHPTIKMLALTFLLFVSVNLIFESFHIYFSKGYIYFSMFFALTVEILNLITRKNF